MPSEKISGSMPGAPFSKTLIGPPERIIPFGRFSRSFLAGVSNRTISEKTCFSLILLAISCVYCEP